MWIVDPYKWFSKVFDKIVRDEKYNIWEEWIINVWNKHNIKPNSLLDLACWTWKNSIRFSNRWLSVFWVDFSKDMIEQAKTNYPNIEFITWHFLNFSIPQKVDTAICLDFSTNYILRESEFIEFLKLVYNNLNDWWIFIFDFKPTHTFSKKERKITNWEFEYEWKCDANNDPFVIIDIEIKLNNWEYFKERHIERWYEIDEIKYIISQTNFNIIDIYDNCVSKGIDEKSELIQIVLKK